MAHTITLCPRCGNDFMYHTSDTHLDRAVPMETNSGEATAVETICQDCDYFEKFGGGIPTELSTTDSVTYENFRKLVFEYWEEGDVNELQEAGYIVHDREKSTDGVIYYRVLTETEFRTRVLKEKL